jgi:hypothetical protein
MMLVVNMLYMRCSEGHWRPGGIRTCGANPSLQKTKIWRNWSLVVIISWTYNAENFAIPLQNAKHLHRKNKSILYAASSRIEKLHQH